MRRRTFLATSALLSAPSWQRVTAAEPEADGIDELLEEVRKKHRLPAVAGAAIHQGNIVSGAVGLRKIGDETKVTVDDQFHIGSCTKSMTATLCGMLVEEGKLKWESTLAELLPELAEKIHADYRPVKVEQLLAHRSGMSADTNTKSGTLRKLYDDGELGATLREQRQKYAEIVLAEKPVSAPGSEFAYSNRNFMLAGAIVERLTDTAWEELMKTRLFEPLGMATAGFGPMGTAGKVEQPWQHASFFGWRTPFEPGPKADNPPVLGPAGTVHSSAGDWAKYIREHLRGESGESKLLKAETFKKLHTPKSGEDYSAGWITTERKWGGGNVLMHNGSNTISYAVVWMATLRDFACLAMTNQFDLAAELGCDDVCSRLIGRFLKS
jgi:CubicO group peptidase (beta-lactamase class C family)